MQTFSLLLRSASQDASSFSLLLESYKNHTIKNITQLSQKYQRPEKGIEKEIATSPHSLYPTVYPLLHHVSAQSLGFQTRKVECVALIWDQQLHSSEIPNH